MEVWEDRLRPHRNHKFYIIEKISPDENKRWFLELEHLHDVPSFTQNVMECTKYFPNMVDSIIKSLSAEHPEIKFEAKLLVVDFDIYPLNESQT